MKSVINKVSKNCINCSKEIIKKSNCSRSKWKLVKFCCRKCHYEHMKGKEGYAKGVPKSKPVWNKGKKGLQVAWNKGKKFSQVESEKNGMWKGNKATMTAIHQWVVRRLGKPQKCEHCGTTEDRMYHWSNISGEYERDIKDWQRLCVPCHKKFDLNRLK